MKLKPTKGQLDFLDWEFGVFFHFGIRSFYPGHRDWDGLEMPLEGFNPDALDCAQWVEAAKEAGAKYAILTAKHHDGFALWPSKYTSYSVAGTPWKNGKGDAVAEFVDACRRSGLKVGLYYSPAQWGSHTVAFENGRAYDDYFISQIGELLTGYGKIDYLWFDGCGSEGHEYDKKRIVGEIYRMQPDILTFCDPSWTPCVRWIGNEDGFASLDNPLVVSTYDFSEKATEKLTLADAAFLPGECDCQIRATWFYDDNADTIKPTDELFGMYESSVGHGSNFLLNVGPDNHGRICEADRERIIDLGRKIRAAYDVPDRYSAVRKNGNTYTVESKTPDNVGLINRVVLKEDLTDGQAVKAFRLYAYLPRYRENKILVYAGTTVGHKLICPVFAIRSPKLELEITDSDGEHRITSIQGYFAD